MRLFFGSFLGAAVGGLLDQILMFLLRTHLTGFVPDMLLSGAVTALRIGFIFALAYTVVHMVVCKPSLLSSLVLGMLFAALMAGAAYHQGQFAPVAANYALTAMLGFFTGLGAAVAVLGYGKKTIRTKTN